MTVVRRGNQQALWCNDIGYSCIYTDDSVYQPILIEPQRIVDRFSNAHTIKEALVLGGGCCTFARFLIKRFSNTVNIDSIEYLPSIIELARKYFLVNLETDKLNIVEDDAYHFIHNTTKQYDFILVDIFVGNIIPNLTNTYDFVSELTQHTSNNSVIVFNGYNGTIDLCKHLCELGKASFKTFIVKDEDGTLFIIFIKGDMDINDFCNFNIVYTDE